MNEDQGTTEAQTTVDAEVTTDNLQAIAEYIGFSREDIERVAVHVAATVDVTVDELSAAVVAGIQARRSELGMEADMAPGGFWANASAFWGAN